MPPQRARESIAETAAAMYRGVKLEREEAIARALDENMLENVYAGLVDRYLDHQDDGWRACCNSSCDPCVLTIGRVVDRARALMDGVRYPKAPQRS